MYNKQGHVCKEIINIVENNKKVYEKGQKNFSKGSYNQERM